MVTMAPLENILDRDKLKKKKRPNPKNKTNL